LCDTDVRSGLREEASGGEKQEERQESSHRGRRFALP
jgi:hypothetical protein